MIHASYIYMYIFIYAFKGVMGLDQGSGFGGTKGLRWKEPVAASRFLFASGPLQTNGHQTRKP